MAFADPRSCLGEFVQTGRNLGKRPPSLSLRNVTRDFRATKTRLENIGDRVEGAVGAAIRGDFLPGQLLSTTNEFRCPPTNYANYFSQNRQPKFKFMFFASMELEPNFVEAFGGKWANGEVWWFIKQAGRPNVSYEYEDVNMYNFRQKILRRATFEPIQIQMYDDLQDASHGFWTTFLRIQNPVTNIVNNSSFIEENGMNWEDANELQTNTLAQIRSDGGEQRRYSGALGNSASTGVLPGPGGIAPLVGFGTQNKQIIKSIKLYHIIDWGRKVVVYDYIHPRINEIRMDELTWDTSDPNMIDVTFEFDTFNIFFPNGINEDIVNSHLPPAYPININSDETPIEILNTGIKTFNNAVNTAVNAVKDFAANNLGIGGKGPDQTGLGGKSTGKL